jgi:hypothetical protein
MGKVRTHIVSDDAALAQWVFRKLVNHDPMSVRESVSMRTKPPAKQKKTLRVQHVEGSTSVIYALADGRQFKLTVEAVKDLDLQLA